jgi:hypothetical protein
MKSDEQILNELRQASAGLMFMSESDYPFETVRWEGLAEINAAYLRSLPGQQTDASVQTVSVDDLFRAAASEADWKGAEELATARTYQALVRLLKENLEDVRVYRVGEINIAVYIVGRSATGNWLGLSTRVVET